jgi:hypothetical protein
MSKLPFVVAPKVNSRIETLGSEISGKIEVERKGFLTVGEKSFMANVNNQDNVLQAVMKLSRSVATHYKLGQQDAYQQVVLAVTEPEKCSHPVYDEFGAEIADLASLMLVTEQKKQLMMAFCMLLYRVDDSLTMDDIIDLHEDLIEALAQLFMDEEAKSLERLVDKEEEEAGPDDGDLGEIEKK